MVPDFSSGRRLDAGASQACREGHLQKESNYLTILQRSDSPVIPPPLVDTSRRFRLERGHFIFAEPSALSEMDDRV